MHDFSTRTDRPELLDIGNVPDTEVRRSLDDLRWINKYSGTRNMLLRALSIQVARHNLTEFSLLDVASGSCDLPSSVIDWTQRRKLKIRVFALEYQHRHLRLFSNELAAYRNLHAFCANALSAPLSKNCVDFVTCSHFIHHLTESQAAQLLWCMHQWARFAVIVTDHERHPVPYYFFRAFSRLFTRSSVTRTDGLISLEKSFTKSELERIAESAGLVTYRVERHWPFQLILIAESRAHPIATTTVSTESSLCVSSDRAVTIAHRP